MLLKFQSEILGISIERPECVETTALGAALLCGLTLGVYASVDEIKSTRKIEKNFTPQKEEEWRKAKIKEWRKAVGRSLGWKE